MTPTQLAKLIYDSETAQLTDVRRAHRLPWKDLPDIIKQNRIATARLVLNEMRIHEQASLQIRDKRNQK